MIKLIKKFSYLWSLLFIIIFSTTIVFAEDTIYSEEIFSYSNCANGTTASTLSDLFNSENNSDAQLSNLTLLYSDEHYELTGTLTYNSTNIQFNSNVTLYKNVFDESSTDSTRFILGDFTDTENLHFVQLKFDDANCNLNLILQLLDNTQLLQFSLPISIDDFNIIYNHIQNPLSGDLLNEKFTKLYNVSGNLITKENTDKNSSTSVIIDDNSNLSRSTYNGWKTLITSLNNNGSVKLSNYSNIKPSWFKTTGWNHDHYWGNAPYSFSIYCTQNGSDEYLAQFALLNATQQIINVGTSGQYGAVEEIRLQVEYVDGLVVRYNTSTDTLSVLNYGFGLDISSLELGIYNLTNDALFITRTVNRNLVSSSNYMRAALALYSPGDTLASLFEYLQPYENQAPNFTQIFATTAEEQYIKYSGKFVRGISVNSSPDKLKKPGHYINLFGQVLYIKTDGYNANTTYRYTCSHYL